MVNAIVKVWLLFVFFFSIFQASGVDQSRRVSRESFLLNTLILGKNLGDSSGICWGSNAPSLGFQRLLFPCHLGGWTRPLFFLLFRQQLELLQNQHSRLLRASYGLRCLGGTSLGFNESNLSIHGFWKQSETGCHLSSSVLTLWSFSAKNNSFFHAICRLYRAWQLCCCLSTSECAGRLCPECTRRRTRELLALSAQHLLCRRCLTRFVWRDSFLNASQLIPSQLIPLLLIVITSQSRDYFSIDSSSSHLH